MVSKSIILSSDWHLSDQPRDAYRWLFVEKTLPALLRKYKPDFHYFLGDLTEQKDRHPSELVNRAAEAINRLTLFCPMIALRGNHDGIDAGRPFFQFLQHFERVRWINSPTKLHNAWFLPHTMNYEKDWHGIDFKLCDIFTHNTFDGAYVGNGRKMRGIPLSIFSPDQRVFSGDIHVPQKLGDGQFWYVGAPYTIDFGDNYLPRVLLISERGCESIPVEGPQKRLIEGAKDKAIQQVKAGDLIKVRITTAPDRKTNWAEIRRKWQDWAAEKRLAHLRIELAIKLEGSSHANPSREQEYEDDRELIERFLRSQNRDDRTLDVGLDIIRQEGP